MKRSLVFGLGLCLSALPACADGGSGGSGGTESAGTEDSDSSSSTTNSGETQASESESETDAGETEAESDAGETDGGEAMWEEVRSDLEYDDMPMPSEDDQLALLDGQRDFSLELFRELRANETGNFSISGLSVHSAFGMLFAGAVGDTRQEMIDHMNFLEGEEAQHVALNWQSLELQSRNLEAVEEEYNMFDPVIYAPANQMWIQSGNEGSVMAPFLDKLSVHYDTGMYLADFAAQPEEERMGINGWVAERTNDLIDALLPPGSIMPDGLTSSVIVNALYFKAPWAAEFYEGSTQQQDFYLADASTVQVDMMHSWALDGNYVEATGYRALGIPLRGNKFELVAILPDAGTDLDAFVDGLTGESLGALFESMTWQTVETFLPRFACENKFELKQALSNLGLPSMFGGGLDDIGGGVNQVSGVFHDTVVIVDEKGVEAAAATAIVNDTSGGYEPDPTGVFRAERPFLFAIYDRPTGTVLFFGQVTNPAE